MSLLLHFGCYIHVYDLFLQNFELCSACQYTVVRRRYFVYVVWHLTLNFTSYFEGTHLFPSSARFQCFKCFKPHRSVACIQQQTINPLNTRLSTFRLRLPAVAQNDLGRSTPLSATRGVPLLQIDQSWCQM